VSAPVPNQGSDRRRGCKGRLRVVTFAERRSAAVSRIALTVGASITIGVAPALVAAHTAAGPHRILVSSAIPDLDEEALVALQPPPGARSVERQLRLVVVTGAAQLAAAQPGEVAVLAGDEVAPAGYTLIDDESLTGPTQLSGPSRRVPLVDVYLRR
jgi:hypothetical protein